jgi:hypothetical protein
VPPQAAAEIGDERAAPRTTAQERANATKNFMEDTPGSESQGTAPLGYFASLSSWCRCFPRKVVNHAGGFRDAAQGMGARAGGIHSEASEQQAVSWFHAIGICDRGGPDYRKEIVAIYIDYLYSSVRRKEERRKNEMNTNEITSKEEIGRAYLTQNGATVSVVLRGSMWFALQATQAGTVKTLLAIGFEDTELSANPQREALRRVWEYGFELSSTAA